MPECFAFQVSKETFTVLELAGVVVQQVKLLLMTPASHIKMLIGILEFLLSIHPPAEDDPVLAPLPPLWEIRMELLASGLA